MSAIHLSGPAAWLLALAALAAPQARAECSYILGNLESKMESHRAHRERNLQMIRSLTGTETSCRDTGAAVSSKIATLAAARSCDAQVDASGMNRELHEIGAKCEAHFRELHRLEVEVRESLQAVKAQLLEGLEFQRNDEVLTEFCGPEIKRGFAVLDEFLALETEILATEARSLDGKTSYGRFKDTADALRAATASRGDACGEMAKEALAVISGVAGRGPARVPVPSGNSPRTASDITGTEEAAEKAAPAGRTAAIQKPALGASTVIGGEERPSAAGLPGTGAIPESAAPPARAPAALRSARHSVQEGQVSSLGRHFDPAGTYSRFGNLSEEAAVAPPPAEGKEGRSVGAALFSPGGEDSLLGLDLPFTGELPAAEAARTEPKASGTAVATVSLFELVSSRYRQTELFRRR